MKRELQFFWLTCSLAISSACYPKSSSKYGEVTSSGKNVTQSVGDPIYVHYMPIKILGISGFKHIAVSVRGKLYEYGRSGMQCHMMNLSSTKMHDFGAPVLVGYTTKSDSEIKQWRDNNKEDYSKLMYHLLSNNCFSFAESLLRFLGVSIPKRISDNMVVKGFTLYLTPAQLFGSVSSGAGTC